MEPARHPFPVSSTARTIGEQKAKVKTFSKMSIDVGWSGQADICRFTGRLAARASKSKSEQDDEVPEQERSHNPTQNRGDLLLIYLHEVGALLDNLFIRLSAATVADRQESEEGWEKESGGKHRS